MNKKKQNIFAIPTELPADDEFLEVLAKGKNLRIQRLISHGHTSPADTWYDQEEDEWVVLLGGEAVLEWGDGSTTRLVAGDSIFIAAHRRHRVKKTTVDPPCVWLAVHGKMQE